MLSTVLLMHSLVFEASASVRFREIVQIQKSHCTCAGTKGWANTSACCGRCSCDEDCYVQGNCCLEIFHDFHYALMTLQETRYTCVNHHYRTKDNRRAPSPHGTLMISKCLPDTDNLSIKHFCENPGSDGTFESVIPVVHIYSHQIYRNRYCAFCNNISLNRLRESWRVEIACENSLSLKTSNLLSTTAGEKCSIILKPPSELTTRYTADNCIGLEYTVNDCPVSETDEATALACRSYVDPFNRTYKNYFCYLCNTKKPINPQDWTCPEPQEESPDERVVFTAMFYLDNIRQLEAEERLNCRRSNQYLDYKKGVCREILCKGNRHFSDGSCKPDLDMADRQCLELYFQLKPVKSRGGKSTDYVFLHELNTKSYLAKFQDQITQLITGDSSVIQVFSVFVDIEKAVASNGNVTVLVVYMLLDIPPEKESEIIQNYEKRHMYLLSLYRGTYPVGYLMTIELFNISWASNSSDETDAEIHVWDDDEERTSVLNMIYDQRADAPSCMNANRTLLQFHGITFCPYLRFSTSEFSTRIENDTLILFEKGMYLGRFHKLEYEWHSDSFNIFLLEYSNINYYMMTPLLPLKQLASGSSDELFDPKKMLNFVIIIW